MTLGDIPWLLELDAAPSFVSDPAREALARLVQSPNGIGRVIHVRGASGVGKTRAVLEPLRGDPSTVFLTDRVHDAVRWIGRPHPGDSPVRTLVVDDLPPEDTAALASRFVKQAPPLCTLITISTREDMSRYTFDEIRAPTAIRWDKHEEHTVLVRGLDRASLGTLLTRAHAPRRLADEVREWILEHADGSVSFALRLLRSLEPQGVPSEPPYGSRSHWYAAARVLAGPPKDHPSLDAWDHDARLHARVLLCATLYPQPVPGEPIDPLEEENENAVTRAILSEGDGPDAWMQAEDHCRARGLLRTVGATQRPHVGPLPLLRAILERLFDPGCNAATRRVQSISEEAPHLFDLLHEICDEATVSEPVRMSLAQAELNTVQAAFARGGLEAVEHWTLDYGLPNAAARLRPRESRALLQRIVSNSTPAALEAAPAFRESMSALIRMLET